MIETFAVALLVFVLAMIGMAVGILTGRHGLGAGCASARAVTDDAPTCQACGQPVDARDCAGATRSSEAGVR